MTTRNLPGSDAARHGTGDADLTIMLAAHAALRRDAARLGADPDHAAATISTLPPPVRLAYRARWKPRYDRTNRW